METDDYAEYLEDSTFVLCLRDGAVFRHAEKELETIAYGKDKTHSAAISFWRGRHNALAYACIPEVL